MEKFYLAEDSDQPDELTTEQKMEMFKRYLTHMSGLSPERQSNLYLDDVGNWTGWRSDKGAKIVYKMILDIKYLNPAMDVKELYNDAVDEGVEVFQCLIRVVIE